MSDRCPIHVRRNLACPVCCRVSQAKEQSSLASATCYASGQEPLKGDLIYNEKLADHGVKILALSEEEKQTWIVMSVCGDMVRCKCEGAENWKQAHYINRMRLWHRAKRHNAGADAPATDDKRTL